MAIKKTKTTRGNRLKAPKKVSKITTLTLKRGLTSD
jgi:hypothetical protein